MGRISKPYIIGETAYHHEGDINYLNKMIDDIAGLKLNAIKFHLLLNPESYVTKSHKLFSEYEKWLFTKSQWHKAINRAKQQKLDVVALCDDVESVKFINKKFCDLEAIELHATGINDYFLLMETSKFKGKIILGIGGSTLDEIQYAIDFLISRKSSEIVLMYGFQKYPTTYADINLSKMLKIRDLFGLPVGYADHTAFDDPNNEIISIMAAAMGFNTLEKHYTPNEGKEKIDFHSAVGKDKMLRIKRLMSLALLVHGTGDTKMSKGEISYGQIGPMKKAVVAKRTIRKGEKITFKNVWFKRTAESSFVKQKQLLNLIGLTAVRNIEKDQVIDFSNTEHEFSRPNMADFGLVKQAIRCK